MGEAALPRQAYNGPACRIKNEMVHHPKPTSLVELRKLVQAIDSHYWEHKAEITRDSTTTFTRQEAKPKPKTDKKAPSMQAKPQNKPAEKSKGALPESPKATPEIVNKLGKDGKLTPQEHQHCLDNGLCLFCAKPRHIAKDCSKTNSSAAKARAAATEEDSMITSDMEAKMNEQPSQQHTN